MQIQNTIKIIQLLNKNFQMSYMQKDLYQQYRPTQQNQMQINQNNNSQLTTNGVCKKFIHGKCNRPDCPHPHNKAKIKPCNNFQAYGRCQYGDKCNFSHETRVCQFFMRGQCQKGQHCSYRHVYKSCPNFDMGFCVKGNNCDLKHIVRRLCWDYMYGFCEKGGRCTDYHPKIFRQEDFKFTQKILSSTGRTLMKFVCNNCAIIGHKVSNCPKRKQIDPTNVFKCGLCGSVHTYEEDCNNNSI